MSSRLTTGVRVPDGASLVVYERMWTKGRFLVSSTGSRVCGLSVGTLLADVRDVGVGPSEMLMICSIPVRQMDSISSPLKKSIKSDFS